ncbi:MAG: TetR/AcrR family transcriptional regulator [Myxococcales bacterium]|nr:TetR/AcrR family transcriptional regulator [Myxococcales bacterium]
MRPTRRKPSLPEAGVPERIVSAATGLFCEKGYAATSVAEIVARAGVTKPVLYYYYGNKAGLFRHLFVRHLESFREMLERVMAEAKTTRERLVLLTREQLSYGRRHFQEMRFILGTVLGPRRDFPRMKLEEPHQINRRLFARLFSEGMASGELRRLDIDEVCAAYMGVVLLASLRQIHQPARAPQADLAERLVDILLSGVGRERPEGDDR